MPCLFCSDLARWHLSPQKSEHRMASLVGLSWVLVYFAGNRVMMDDYVLALLGLPNLVVLFTNIVWWSEKMILTVVEVAIYSTCGIGEWMWALVYAQGMVLVFLCVMFTCFRQLVTGQWLYAVSIMAYCLLLCRYYVGASSCWSISQWKDEFLHFRWILPA